jgi:hypothetical protein
MSKCIVMSSSYSSAASLPSPVRRYFRTVLGDDAPVVRVARFTQRGAFRRSPSENDESGWIPFDAEESFGTQPPEFAWNARMRMAPLVTASVRDRYLGGHGSMLVTTARSLIKIVDQHDRPELDAGALQRYLAEAVWFPTALLPSQCVVWAPVDDSHALVSLTDGATSVSLEVEFNTKGEIAGVLTERYYESKGHYVLTPWGSRCRRYEERSGMRIPIESEAYWKIDGKIRPYWRGEIVRAEYDFAQ